MTVFAVVVDQDLWAIIVDTIYNGFRAIRLHVAITCVLRIFFAIYFINTRVK